MVCVRSCLQVYPKLSQTYYVLLECLAQDHMNFLDTLEPSVFLYILSSISEGLSAIGKLGRDAHLSTNSVRTKTLAAISCFGLVIRTFVDRLLTLYVIFFIYLCRILFNLIFFYIYCP